MPRTESLIHTPALTMQIKPARHACSKTSAWCGGAKVPFNWVERRCKQPARIRPPRKRISKIFISCKYCEQNTAQPVSSSQRYLPDTIVQKRSKLPLVECSAVEGRCHCLARWEVPCSKTYQHPTYKLPLVRIRLTPPPALCVLRSVVQPL